MDGVLYHVCNEAYHTDCSVTPSVWRSGTWGHVWASSAIAWSHEITRFIINVIITRWKWKSFSQKPLKSNTEEENTYDGDSNGDQGSQDKLWLSSCGLKSLDALTTLLHYPDYQQPRQTNMIYSCFLTEIGMRTFYKQHMSQRFPGMTKHDINFTETSLLTTPPNESQISLRSLSVLRSKKKKMTLYWSHVQNVQ